MPDNIPRDYEFTLALEPVSPICIASGRKFLPVDYVATPQKFIVKNVRAYLARGKASVEEKERVISGGQAKYIPAEFDAYTLRNWAGTDFGNNPILEFMRDAEGRAFIPGSSIKGVVRTAVLFWAFTDPGGTIKEDLERLVDKALDKRAKKAYVSQELQRKILSGCSDFTAPNRDAMKSLIIRDSQPIPNDRLTLCKAVVWRYDARTRAWEPKRTGNADMAAFVEAIVPGSSEQPPIQISFVFKGYFWKNDREAGLPENLRGLFSNQKELMGALQEYGRRLLFRERDFYRRVGDEHARVFCNTLLAECEKRRDIAFLPIGFSTGWRTKTLGVLLSEKQSDKLVRDYDLDRGRNSDPFPKTRKLVQLPGDRQLPMGWARLSLVRTPAQGQGGG